MQFPVADLEGVRMQAAVTRELSPDLRNCRHVPVAERGLERLVPCRRSKIDWMVAGLLQ